MQQDYADTHWRHPYEDEDDYPSEEIEVARKMMDVMQLAVDYMDESPKNWGVAFAIGSKACMGRSMSEVAAKIGCTRADISHFAQDFCRVASIPPSPYMKIKR